MTTNRNAHCIRNDRPTGRHTGPHARRRPDRHESTTTRPARPSERMKHATAARTRPPLAPTDRPRCSCLTESESITGDAAEQT
eukprot:5923117-Prymnesium_polylepis.3